MNNTITASHLQNLNDMVASEAYADIQRASHCVIGDTIGSIIMTDNSNILRAIENNGTWEDNGFINVFTLMTPDTNEIYFSMEEILNMKKVSNGVYRFPSNNDFVEITLLGTLS